MPEVLALKKIVGIQVSNIISGSKVQQTSQEKHPVPKVDFQNR